MADARYCPSCGSPLAAGARFCSACGSPLAGAAERWQRREGAPASTRLPVVGLAVFLGGLIGGLSIWAFILFPPRNEPRFAGPRAGAVGSALPQGHPPVDRPSLPAEAKRLLGVLAERAERVPQKVDPWLKLAEARYRAARVDPSYYPQALAAYEHVLELDPANPEALRGAANVHFDRNETEAAIDLYKRYLKVRPDDAGARTDLATMYLYSGDAARAAKIYEQVLAANPRFFQAQVNLAIAYRRQGKPAKVAEALRAARKLAPNDAMRTQIDQMLAALQAQSASAASPTKGAEAATASAAFHAAVEQAFRDHPILGPRIVRFEWQGPATGRVLIEDFPMEAMPAGVRKQLLARLGEAVRRAKKAAGLSGTVRVGLTDAASGRLMSTVTD